MLRGNGTLYYNSNTNNHNSNWIARILSISHHFRICAPRYVVSSEILELFSHFEFGRPVFRIRCASRCWVNDLLLPIRSGESLRSVTWVLSECFPCDCRLSGTKYYRKLQLWLFLCEIYRLILSSVLLLCNERLDSWIGGYAILSEVCDSLGLFLLWPRVVLLTHPIVLDNFSCVVRGISSILTYLSVEFLPIEYYQCRYFFLCSGVGVVLYLLILFL